MIHKKTITYSNLKSFFVYVGACAMTAGACVSASDNHDIFKVPDFKIENKPLNIGTLDYLNQLGQWDKKSLYTLGEAVGEGFENVDPSTMEDNLLLRYEIAETFLYCDRYTGEIFDKPRDGMGDIPISVRNLNPVIYPFSFTQTIFGDPETSSGDIHYKHNIDYVIGKTSEFGHYVPESPNEKKDNASGEITGAFLGSFSEDGTPLNGGTGQAIYNKNNKEITSVHADFFDCFATSGDGGGGAISNWNGTTILGGIHGNFTNNSVVKGNGGGSEGGAIWNWDGVQISVIEGDFIGNYVGKEGSSEGKVRGGAIYNYNKSYIGTITGHFVGNAAYGGGSGKGDSYVVGGAIANGSGSNGGARIDLVVADFIGNSVYMTSGDGHGGAIYNGGKDSTIDYLIGDFYGNSVDVVALRNGENYTQSTRGRGGAICNIGVAQGDDTGRAIINNIKAAFVRNYVRATMEASGGAIYNNRGALINNIESNFVRNYAEQTLSKEEMAKLNQKGYASGGAILNYHKSDAGPLSEIKNITGNFYGNFSRANGGWAEGGAISNWEDDSVIGKITGNFIDNHATSIDGEARGGAIYTEKGSTIDEIRGSFYYNHAESGSSYARGGAIYNGGDLDRIVNSVFEGNYAKGKPGEDATVHGGAIYNIGTLSIVADNGVSYFNDNYTIEIDESGNVQQKEEAIYAREGSSITLEAINDGAIVFHDMINGREGKYNLLLQGDDSSIIVFDHIVNGANITMDHVNLSLYSGEDGKWEGEQPRYMKYQDKEGNETRYNYSDVLRTSSLEIRSGQVLMADGKITEHLFKDITAYGKGYTYAENGKNEDAAQYTSDQFATFTIDVDWGKEVADVITAFATKGQEKEAGSSKGRITVSDINFFGPTYWGNMDKFQKDEPVKIQVINYVALEGDREVTDKEYYDQFLASCPIELDEVELVGSARSRMRSSQMVFDRIELGTTKTHNDSIVFTGLLDNLAEWAELNDRSAEYSWVKSDITPSRETMAYKTYDDVPEEDREKVFTIIEPTQHLTRNTKDTAVWGDKWTIRGMSAVTHDWSTESIRSSALNLHNWNLLTEVKENQHGFLQGFELVNVGNRNTIVNNGSLTLDTMIVEDGMTIRNNHELTVTGVMELNNEVTSDEKKPGTLRIDDSTAVALLKSVEPATLSDTEITDGSDAPNTDGDRQGEQTDKETAQNTIGYTNIRITGKVQNQNIVHATVLTEEQKAGNISPHVVTHMDITDGDGNQTDVFKSFKNNSLDMQAGDLYLHNLGSETLTLRSLNISGGSIYLTGALGVNLYTQQMGHIEAGGYGYNPDGGHIYVERIKLIRSVLSPEVRVSFADKEIARSVVPFADEEVKATPSGESGMHYMWDPIILWYVTYDYDTGEYVFRQNPISKKPDVTVPGNPDDPDKKDDPVIPDDPDKKDDPVIPDDPDKKDDPVIPDDPDKKDDPVIPDDPDKKDDPVIPDDPDKKDDPVIPGTTGSVTFNPAIMAGAVAEQMGGYTTLLEVYDYSFEHAELFSATLDRARKADRTGAEYAGFKRGMWMHPYSSFERLPMYDGTKVSSIRYGALVGGDTKLKEHSNGWASVFSAFGGYVGSTQKFSRSDSYVNSAVRTTMNGGVVGATETLYYRGFFTAITATVGSSSVHSATMYGSENYRLHMGGVASRSGYNIELSNGRYVIQPTLQMSYSYLNMPDYTNAAGVRVHSDALQVFQLHPYIKGSMHLENGWTPFFTVGYVHNFAGDTKYYVEGYKLPGVEIDPYVEYSLGLQKTWNDRYTLYSQVIGRNGGRRGVEFSIGIRTAW